MNAKKPKHSKYKNTGLIFEFLMRQVTSDVLNNVKDSVALELIRKRFNEHTSLGKELALYNILISQKFDQDKRADYFISEVLNNRDRLNSTLLRREKYNVIKSIKENYNVDEFFSTNVSNYKVYASIFKLFEHSKNLSPDEKTESYFNILEHVTTKLVSNDVKLNPSSTTLKEDEDLRILTYKIILEKFNSKYSTLSNNQRILLRNYINNVSNTNSLKEYMEKKIPTIKKELKTFIPKVKNKVVKIKLKEAINSINKFCSVGKNKTVKDSSVVQMMRYFELIKELKKMDNLRKVIKSLIEEIEEELEEATVTADIEGYNTPYAFSDGTVGKKKKNKKISTNSTGYKVVKEDINEKDLKLIKSVIRNEVADILKTIWLKRATWKQ